MDLQTILLQTATGEQPQGNWLINILPWIAILAVFYFFMIRPQQKRAKEEKNFRASLEKNTHIVTIGGIHGVITEVADDTVLIKTEGGQKMRIEKSAVSINSAASLGEKALQQT